MQIQEKLKQQVSCIELYVYLDIIILQVNKKFCELKGGITVDQPDSQLFNWISS